MATILCLTSTVPGMLYPGVELARRLARAGHRVTCASFDDARETVEGQDLDFLALPPSRYRGFLAADAEAPVVDRLRRLGARRRQALESLAVAGLARTVRRLDPDLLLIDGEMHEHVIAASAAGRPIALLNSFVSIWRRPGLPPPHCLARPGVGFRGSTIGTWLLWRALAVKKRRAAWRLAIRRLGCDRLSLLRRLARDRGFDFRRETDAGQWLIPFTYRRLPVLSLHAREFEFPHRPPERVTYVGPMVLKGRGDERLTGTQRAELERLLERRRAGGRSLIYAGFGSFFTAEPDLPRRLAEATTARDDWDLVISLGGRLDPAELGPLPERVHAFRWLPQLEVLRHADVAITHGGINTLDECVLAGVPTLIFCGHQTDMAGNTSRVLHHGLGLAGDRRDGAGKIRERLDRLLREPRFRDNVARMRHRYLDYEQRQVAERAVDRLLEPAGAEAAS